MDNYNMYHLKRESDFYVPPDISQFDYWNIEKYELSIRRNRYETKRKMEKRQ